LLVLALGLAAWLLRVVVVVRSRRAARPAGPPPICTMAVLGSGGHTAEMISLLKTMDPAKYAPMLYVIATTDSTSLQRIETFESERPTPAPYRILRIPRSREVGQSYVTSAFTTLYALVFAVGVVLRARPSLLLCNGPGTCIPICASALLLRVLGIKYVTIIYAESVCRVKSLSMSGKIMIHFADQFLVQWPQMAKLFPKATYIGRVC